MPIPANSMILILIGHLVPVTKSLYWLGFSFIQHVSVTFFRRVEVESLGLLVIPLSVLSI